MTPDGCIVHFVDHSKISSLCHISIILPYFIKVKKISDLAVLPGRCLAAIPLSCLNHAAEYIASSASQAINLAKPPGKIPCQKVGASYQQSVYQLLICEWGTQEIHRHDDMGSMTMNPHPTLWRNIFILLFVLWDQLLPRIVSYITVPNLLMTEFPLYWHKCLVSL